MAYRFVRFGTNFEWLWCAHNGTMAIVLSMHCGQLHIADCEKRISNYIYNDEWMNEYILYMNVYALEKACRVPPIKRFWVTGQSITSMTNDDTSCCSYFFFFLFLIIEFAIILFFRSIIISDLSLRSFSYIWIGGQATVFVRLQ